MIRSATTLALGILLAALPVSMTSGDNGMFGAAELLAAQGGNGKGNAGGNGKGNSANGANAPAAAAQNGTPKDKTQLAKNDPLHPHHLGRLNSFFNASPESLKNASPTSAIGLISQVYAGQLSAYIGALATAAINGTDPLATAELEAAALTLATAANKPLSPEIIAAVHEHIASQNPDNLALAGLASPALADPNAATIAAANAALVANILAAASLADGQITSNGLGPIY